VLERSVDGMNLQELDRQENFNQLENDTPIATFKIGYQADVQLIRICQTGPNSSGQNQLTISAIEFFGAMGSNDSMQNPETFGVHLHRISHADNRERMRTK
jgi:hypothetical protein